VQYSILQSMQNSTKHNAVAPALTPEFHPLLRHSGGPRVGYGPPEATHWSSIGADTSRGRAWGVAPGVPRATGEGVRMTWMLGTGVSRAVMTTEAENVSARDRLPVEREGRAGGAEGEEVRKVAEQRKGGQGERWGVVLQKQLVGAAPWKAVRGRNSISITVQCQN